MEQTKEEPKSSRVILWVTGIHVAVVVAAIGVSLFRGCLIRPAEPQQIVSFVELAEPEPTPIQAPPEPDPAPEPPPLEPPLPEPKPIPNKVKVNKDRKIRKPKPETPKPPPKRRVTEEEIRKNLELDNAKPRPQAVSDDHLFRQYYAMVRRVVYGVWQEPSASSVAPGSSAKVVFVVQRDGVISRVSLERSSGSPLLDASALKAVQSVPKLDPLPEKYRGRSKQITIDFQLTGSGV